MRVPAVFIAAGLLLWPVSVRADAIPNRLIGFGVLAGLSALTTYLGGCFGVLVGWLAYLPLCRLVADGPVQSVMVWLQSVVLFVGVGFMLRHRWTAALPVLAFVAALLGMGAIAALDPWAWTIHPS